MTRSRLARGACSAALALVVAACRPSPGASHRALGSTDPVERERAATALRSMYAKDRAALGDHGEAYWAERLARARGKPTPEVVNILGGARLSGGEAGGGGETVTTRLDDFWIATIGRSTRGDDVVFDTGRPRRNVLAVDVRYPKGYTGAWTTYYVHGAPRQTLVLRDGVAIHLRELHEGGQPWREVAYVDGKPDGTAVTRTAEGRIEREEVWAKGQQVSERSFHPNGAVHDDITYVDGKLDRVRTFSEAGDPRSCLMFRAGVSKPCPE